MPRPVKLAGVTDSLLNTARMATKNEPNCTGENAPEEFLPEGLTCRRHSCVLTFRAPCAWGATNIFGLERPLLRAYEKVRNRRLIERMVTGKVAHSHKDGHTNGSAAIKSKKMTLVSYLRSLRETVVEQFRSAPFALGERDAEKCATEVMKVIERNHRRARDAGLIEV